MFYKIHTFKMKSGNHALMRILNDNIIINT